MRQRNDHVDYNCRCRMRMVSLIETPLLSEYYDFDVARTGQLLLLLGV